MTKPGNSSVTYRPSTFVCRGKQVSIQQRGGRNKLDQIKSIIQQKVIGRILRDIRDEDDEQEIIFKKKKNLQTHNKLLIEEAKLVEKLRKLEQERNTFDMLLAQLDSSATSPQAKGSSKRIDSDTEMKLDPNTAEAEDGPKKSESEHSVDVAAEEQDKNSGKDDNAELQKRDSIQAVQPLEKKRRVEDAE